MECKLVNLADVTTVKKLAQREKDIRKQEMNDLRTVLSTASGRRLIWRLLERCKTFGSIYNTDSSTMSYLAGKQDLGHFIIAEITQADENLLLKLMKENKNKGDV